MSRGKSEDVLTTFLVKNAKDLVVSNLLKYAPNAYIINASIEDGKLLSIY